MGEILAGAAGRCRRLADDPQGGAVMESFTVVRCEGCGRIWALDFQPDNCRCAEGDADFFPGSTIWEIEADDYRQAVALAAKAVR